MEKMKKDLQALLKALKQLTLKTEQMAKKVGEITKAKPAKKKKARAKAKSRPKVKARAKVKAKAKARLAKKAVARKPAKETAIDAVMNAIGSSGKGVTRKAAKETAIDAVMNAIGSSGKGVTTAQIGAKTGFKNKKIWDNVNRLKQQGRVKSAGKGVYAKA